LNYGLWILNEIGDWAAVKGVMSDGWFI